ncbi:hypothetical protein [Allochromatium palmeri]|uniref:Uncharacterized protein n=1 Tax=Allochromatium palmeri TaxID=231048 RepID=A0A6N8EJX0_9GAMM|nr:hypothetical protein [Allochromatium palmeri]MTW22624.1 hypothetical protein [Allochromatium palmeri]
MNSRALSNSELEFVLKHYSSMTAKSIAEHLTAERGEDSPIISEGQIYSAVKRTRKTLQMHLVELEKIQEMTDEDEADMAELRAALAQLEPHRKAVQRRAQMRSLAQYALG